jgi:rubrerythrin
MNNVATVADLIELAIRLEYAASTLYQGMETKFAHQAEVAGFWHRYAAEEIGHARWLERLRKTSGAEQLAMETDPLMLRAAVKMSEFSVDNALKNMQTLDDAYELACELENSETNAIFEFLFMNYYADADAVTFLRSQLREHVSKLMNGFPEGYRSREARQNIKVRA